MAKEFKRGSGKDSKDKKAGGAKKERSSGKDKKPSFERYRDESRPSDFGTARPRTGANDDKKRSPSAGKPVFRKHNEEGDNDRKPAAREKKSGYADFKRKASGDKPAFRRKNEDEQPERSSKKNYDDDFYESKPSFVRASDIEKVDYEQEYQDRKNGIARKSRPEPKTGGHVRPYKKRSYEKGAGRGPSSDPHKASNDGTIRLNKYISNAGICSRREADDLIASGVVQVNGKVITEMGYKVKPTDVIKYGGQTLKKERLVYLILNKPKDYITTADDPQQRKTVLELVQNACHERIYPVGRLDRATTGLLMFTNDGELTKKLTHPRYGVRKVYHVELDKPLKRADMDQIMEGIELEDGNVKVDEISYVGDGKDKASIGVEIHSGKNRIVRRIFEHFGYNVRKLDRVIFGPLTKKDMPRGRWRFLTDSEIGMLKMVSEKKA